MNKHWLSFIMAVCASRWVRQTALTLYYLGIILGLVALYGKGDFTTPPFVYQRF